MKRAAKPAGSQSPLRRLAGALAAPAVALGMGAAAPAAAQAVPEDFVDLRTLVPDLAVDLRYLVDDNFVGAPIDGYEEPVCLLTRPAAEALAAVQRRLAAFGFGLKVFDCYRPARAVAHFVRWAADPDDEGRKATYYPDVPKSELFSRGYIAERSGHSRGSTLDLTLVDRASGAELPMGTAFDWFGEESWPANLSIAPQHRANRLLLRQAMTDGGFLPLEQEWWHFTLADEPWPETYFDFPVRRPDSRP